MTIKSVAAWWWSASSVALALIVSFALLRYRGILPEGGFALGTLAVFIAVAIVAVWLNQQSSRFDLTVAAETLVALGIFSLIVGLVAAIFKALSISSEAQITSLQDIRPLASSFLEGLLTAAAAPFLAATLRNYEVISETRASGDGSASDIAEAAKNFVRQMDTATKSVRELAEMIDKQRGSIVTALGAIDSEATKFTVALDRAGTAVASSADTLAKSFASEAAAMKSAAAEPISHMKGLGAAANHARESILTVSEELDRLKESTSETTALLDALAKLIESVERFVKPAA